MPAWPKLPTELHTGAYVLYKQGTAWAISWLQKNSNATNNDEAPAKPTTRELLKQAEAIAKAANRPPDVIDFCNRVQDVITWRKKVTDWYVANTLGDAQHDFFTGRLEDILFVVEEKVKGTKSDVKRRKSKKKTVEQNDDAKRTLNLYGILAEDPADSVANDGSDDEATTTSTSKSTPRSATNNMDAAAEAVSELRFATMCFLYDLSLARQSVRKVWQAYKDHEVDLVTASVTTNVAIGTIKRSVAIWDNAVKDILPCRPGEFFSVTAAMDHFYTSISVSTGHAPYDPKRGLDQFGPDMHRTANLLCLPAIIQLDFHRRAISKRSDPDSQLSALNTRKELEVQNILSDFGLFGALRVKAPALDELTRFESLLTKAPNSKSQWVSFAFQVYLDIYECLGDGIRDGLKDLVEGGHDIENMIDTHIIDEGVMQVQGTRLEYMLVQQPDFSARFNEVSSYITRWVDDDAVGEAIKHMGVTNSPLEPFFFLGHHPLLCGMFLHTIRRLTQEVSISHTRWLIAAVAHLYNAARQVGGLEIPWKDLDYVIDHHSAKRIFVGAAPTSADLFWIRRRLAFGEKLANFAPHRHGDRKHDTTNRGLILRSPLQDLIWKQQRDTKDHGWLTLHHLLEHLTHNDAGAHDVPDLDNDLQHTVQSIPDVSRDETPPANTQPAGTQLADDAPKLSKAQKKRQKQKAKKAEQAAGKQKPEVTGKALLETISTSNIETAERGLTPQLSTLRELLAADELHSHFDYLSLSRRCMTLLQRLRTEIYENEVTDVVAIDDEVELPSNLDLIDRLFLELRDKPKDLVKITRVGDIFRDFIKKEGDMELEEATERKESRSLVWETALEYPEGQEPEHDPEEKKEAQASEAPQDEDVKQEVDEKPTAPSIDSLQPDHPEHEPEQQHPVQPHEVPHTPSHEERTSSDNDSDDGEEQWVDAEESLEEQTATEAGEAAAGEPLPMDAWQEFCNKGLINEHRYSVTLDQLALALFR
ncbi:uncharacterized protein BDZ99DRAFT_571040 [Mytilinidion resinicola]|uniref:DUF6604 domain-containing protein n=1 Tax=Mytilinidion resinicola TaxID=574789 RepID=A0A6A6YRE4_9PEZI|nr:uncharacterized protein BDZ99DRAFT_571040 [Mytilinidion resinicola]KAF2810467.1 hypothetical protein BDZ99DRAFT_571040 [Mytilinidion resinicola]